MACTLITPPAARSLIRNPIYITLQSDLFSGAEAPYTPDEDNLQCRIEIWRETTGPEDIFLARRIAPYSRTTKQVTFDISKVLPYTTALPSEASIGVTDVGTDPLSGEAEGLTMKYRIKYADQFGDPVVPETLTVSGYYVAISGGLPADHRQSINYAGKLIPLHSYFYRRASAYTYYKPVGETQPDWIYFVSLIAGTIQVKVTIHYDDGTYEFVDSHTIDVLLNRAYWMQSGFAQLKVQTLSTHPTKVITGYDVSLIDVATEQNAFTAFYLLDMECPSWEKVLLYHNGFGGYESVRMKGKTTYGHFVERELFERTPWTDFDIKTGTIDHIQSVGGSTFTLSTGHYPPWYLDHLRQLLHGRLWLVDRDLDELEVYAFKRILCTTTQVEVRKDDPTTPESFSIACRHSWRDDGFNVF